MTSVHVEEYSLEVRETKRGMEELTSDIPNVSEEATKDLDENGIVRIGARIEPGDIMIGKITNRIFFIIILMDFPVSFMRIREREVQV